MKRQLLTLAAAAILPVALMAARPDNFPKPVAKSWEREALSGNPSLDAWRTKAALGTGANALRVAPAVQYDNASDWGVLTCEDGTQLVYTSVDTYADEFGSFLSSSLVTVFDDKGGELGTIDIQVPDGYRCNSIQLLPDVTSKFFDFDSNSQEVVVSMHVFDTDYNMGWITAAYEIGSSEPKFVCDGIVAKMYNSYVNSWTQTQILVIEREEEGQDGEIAHLDVYRRGGWGDDGPVVAHTFSVPIKLLIYSEYAPYFNIYNLGGHLYYAISHYETGYMTPESEMDYTLDPVPQEGNHYIVELYGDDFESVETLTIPVEQTEGFLYTFYGFGAFSYDDLTLDTFAPGLNYIITKQGYVAGSDDFRYTIEAYTSDGAKAAVIAQDVLDWKQLYTLPGEEKQYTFIKENADAEQYLAMVNYPSLTQGAAEFPVIIDGQMISFNFDRYANVEGETQYVFSLATGDVDEEGNVYALIGWYNDDATPNHIDRIPLGQDCIYYSAVIYGDYLTPYLFNTDNYYEYIGIAKIMRNPNATETEAENILVIANSNEQVLEQFRGDAERGDYWYGGIINGNQLYIAYLNQDTWLGAIDLYTLPFGEFYAGGDGTAANPYLIATPGDLKMVKANPNASYKITADLDMGYFPQGWTPLESFGGTLDGCGHTIWNLLIDTDAYEAGLIGNLIGENSPAVVKNIHFADAKMVINSQCNSAGLVAGTAINAQVSNITVDGLEISCSGSGYATAGGLLGNAYITTSATACGIIGLQADVKGVDVFGGILGEARTGSKAEACAVEGSITGRSQLGGIIGSTVSGDEAVINCSVNADIAGNNTIGGIVGAGRPAIKNCVYNGEITASHPGWDGLAAGGIIGYLTPDWSDSGAKIISGNVVYGHISAEPDGTVHRIAGYTLANEEDLETAMTESGLSDNYVSSGNASQAPFDAEIGADDPDSTEGADADITEALMGQIGFMFGESQSEPWVYPYKGFPTLYFMAASDISLSASAVSLSIDTDAERSISFTVEGYDPNALVISLPAILQETSREISGNTVTISFMPVANGDGIVTARAGFVTASTLIEVSAFSGIENVASDAAALISYDGHAITAPGEIAIYDMRGNLVALSRGAIDVSALAKGIYVAVAIDGTRRQAIKFAKQ